MSQASASLTDGFFSELFLLEMGPEEGTHFGMGGLIGTRIGAGFLDQKKVWQNRNPGRREERAERAD